MLAGVRKPVQPISTRVVARLAMLSIWTAYIACSALNRGTRPARFARAMLGLALVPLMPVVVLDRLTLPLRQLIRWKPRRSHSVALARPGRSATATALRRIAQAMVRTRPVKPWPVNFWNYPGVRRLRQRAATALDLRLTLRRWWIRVGERSRRTAPSRWNASAIRRLRTVVRQYNWLLSSETWDAIERLKYWLSAIRGVKNFVAAVRPDIIVLPEDNIETISRAFVTYGRRNRARTVILPFTIPNPLEPAQFYADDPRHHVRGALSFIVSRCWPKWRFQHAGRPLMRLSCSKALAIEVLGLSTPAPWILNRGGASAIVLDSNAQRDLYLALGFPPHQLRVIGDTYGATLATGLRLARQRRAAVLSQYGMAPDRPLVVCAFPPDQYSGASTRSFEFTSFEALVEAWMQTFHRLGDTVNVIIRPHPRLDLKLLAPHERSNIRVSLTPTVELVPIADLYVASISATIRWAIACGIPVVNYDTYRYRYGDYASVEGVAHVEGADAFRATLSRFLEDPAYASHLRQQQIAASRHWGMVDDAFPERLSTLLADLSGGDPARWPSIAGLLPWRTTHVGGRARLAGS